jgi:hypothetical protein
MQQTSGSQSLFDRGWFVAWGLASSVFCLTAAWSIGPTFDEPLYVSLGLDFWRTGSHAGFMRYGTMPLPIDLQTLPLYLWERWHEIRLEPVHDLEAILPSARAVTLAFWWLLLWYARQAARLLGGVWAGRFAVALIACEPTFLAHAGLATTDIAVTACLLALLYHFRVGRESGWWRRVVLPGTWFGVALLCKASALVFAPLCMLAIELDYLGRRRILDPSEDEHKEPERSSWRKWLASWWQRLRPLRRDGLQAGLLGMALVFLYCGCDWRVQSSFVAWAHKLPAGQAHEMMVWVAEHLRVFPNAGEALVRQVGHNLRGHGVYLLGQTDSRSIWYYFPVALAIKLSLPLLILPLVLLFLRPRTLGNWACLAAAVLLVYSLNCRVQIGIRFMLPLVALAVVGVSAATVRAQRELGGWRRNLLRAGSAAGLGWMALAALLTWPHGLCYTNELWGGTERGYLYLSDSNYDWGQGLPELDRWRRRKGIDNLDVWYFGTDPAVHSLPVRAMHFHTPEIRTDEDVLRIVRGRYLAACTTLVYGSYSQGAPVAVRLLRSRRPIDRTQTFLIYDFTDAEVEGRLTQADAMPSKTGSQGKLNVAATAGLVTRP